MDITTKNSIKANLKIVMSSMDLDTATSKQIQESLKIAMPGVPLEKYKKYIDNEVRLKKNFNNWKAVFIK